jgi:hypothetical protein
VTDSGYAKHEDPRGHTLVSHEASKHHLLKFGFLLLVRFNLGFTTEGRLATMLIIPFFWGFQRAVLTSHQSHLSDLVSIRVQLAISVN